MIEGEIKRWFLSKGFGFASRFDGQPDVFVHFSNLTTGDNSLPVGQRVRFEIGTNRDGKVQAINVSPVF